MRVSLGPLSLERQSSRPYVACGYQIEPSAWVLRFAKGSYCLPWRGPARGVVQAWAAVLPSAVRVTDPLGRRWVRSLTQRADRFWVLGGVLLVLALTGYSARKRRRNSQRC